MKNSFLLFVLMLTITMSFAQLKTNLPASAITEVEINANQYLAENFTENNQFHFITEVPIPVSDDGPFITFSISWEILSEEGKVEKILFQEEAFIALPLNHHIEKPSDRLHSELGFLKSDTENLILKIETTDRPDLKMKIHFYNPGFTTQNDHLIPETIASQSVTCPCPQPPILTRSDWCPNGGCPGNSNPTETIATHLIIHHSAGVNTSSDWSAVVRGIWNYHVNTLGWSDVGYNWLVDPNGKLYEGRGKDEQGAHFCGTNFNTAGICLLGTYTTEEPQPVMIQTLKEMLAWYVCVDDIDPLGVSNHSSSGLDLNHISGHRDGCATACPGDAFYPSIAGLRTEVSNHIDQFCGTGLPDVYVASLSVGPDTIYTNEVSTVSTTISNQGDVIAENINVVLSLNGNLLASNMISNLEPGESAMFSNTYVFQETGTALYCVSIDPVSNEVQIENNDSCLEANVESIVNIKDFSNAQLSLFPNPNTGYFIIKNQLRKSGEITIYNSLGQVIQSSKLLDQEQQDFNLSQYSKGVYFLKVKIEGNSYFKKIIIE